MITVNKTLCAVMKASCISNRFYKWLHEFAFSTVF